MKKIRSIEKVYHLADEYNWPSIKKMGLLSAQCLMLNTGKINLLNCYRTENTYLSSSIMIRDQRPMPPKALQRSLISDLQTADWYAHLNQQVFFWVDLARLDRQRRACKTPQYLMIIDAGTLLQNYGELACVTAFNTGNAMRAAARRSLTSFVPYHTWVDSAWETENPMPNKQIRLPSHKPVELTIRDSVPNIFNFVLEYYRLQPTDEIGSSII